MQKNNVIIPTFIILMGMLCTQQSSASPVFTFKPTYIPANGLVLYERCADAAERLKNNNFSPTYVRITGQDNLWHLQRGVQVTDEAVMLYSRGFRGQLGVIGTFIFRHLNYGQSLPTIYKYIQSGSIQCSTIGFDYIDTVDNFDHGCAIRAECLRHTLNHVQQKTKNIILFGDSIGAKTILCLATQNPLDHVKALVLESPLFDMKNMVRNEAKHDFWWLPDSGKEKLYDMLCRILPKYKPEDEITLERLANVPKDIPIFYAHLYNDNLIDNQTAKDLVKALRDSEHTVYFIVIDNPKAKHSRIADSQPFIKAVNAFYKKYDLPYNADLAQEGQEILERALENTTSNSIEHIEPAN